MLRTLAFYLPQFHRVPENDQWWGEGFTDWDAVRHANRLFEGHNQPRVPLHKNYYDLMKYETMAWQAELMHKYHIDGMCMYHYWFENGRKILEKPAQNLLNWKDILMPFCFCWANESWGRTWKKFIDTNVWMNIDNKKNDIKGNDILLKQIYGRESDWEKHIQYLLPFFQDDRYIKLEGKPVFVIFKPEIIFQLYEMIRYFDRRVRDNGFQGIYVIGMESEWQDGLDAICIKQPRYAILEYQKRHGYTPQTPDIYPYDEICDIQMETTNGNNKTYFSCVVDHDTTPRMGGGGIVLQDASPDKFYSCIKKLFEKSMEIENEFLFINAWNEWGEGMYLEPDEKNGYEYLKAVKKAATECEIEWTKSMKEKDQCIMSLSRHDQLLDKWLILKEQKINFSLYFNKYGYKHIAIYGMGKLGKHLQQELKDSNVKIVYGIDKNSQKKEASIDVYVPSQQLPNTDAVVITILSGYKEVCDLLREYMNCPLISLEEIIQELLFEC